MKGFLLSLLLCISSSVVNATNTEFTAGTLDIINLPNQSGTTNWQLGDDAISNTINLDFSFDFYGETFTSGKGATNGCWTFTGYNNTCSDYTPDPLPQSGMDMTIFPLWGDWIRDSGSKMLYKTFGDTADTDQYFVLGWYNMREYNRSSDNTFEMLLYEGTNKIEFRYGDLNIVKHDIVVGVQGHATNSSHTMYNANEYKVYLHHNECSSGTQHDSYDTNCVNTDWNNTSHNTAIENKSLSIVVDDQYACTANTLFASTCTGYAAAYLTQQCNINSLYDAACTGYSAALFDYECDQDSQFSPACPNYTVTESVAYYVEEEDYGYQDDYYEDQYGYDEYGYSDDYYEDEYFLYEEDYYEDEYLTAVGYEEDYYWIDDDPYANMEFTDEEWYEIDLEEFGQEQVDDWYGTEVSFDDEGLIVWEDSALDSWDELDLQMDEYDEFVEIYEEDYYEEEYYNDPLYEEYYEEEYFTYEEEYYDIDYEADYSVVTLAYTDEVVQEYERQYLLDSHEETEPEYVNFETAEELDEWYEEEMEAFEEQYGEEESYDEEEYFEETEEMVEEFEEEEFLDEEIEEEIIEEEEVFVEEIEEMQADEEEISVAGTRETRKGMDMEQALNVVAETVQTAANSMSGTTSGTSIQATGTSVASGGISTSTSTMVASSASMGGISTTSSPSISAQIVSSVVQTQQILQMSPSTTTDFASTMSSNVGASISSMDTSISSTIGSSNTSTVNTTSDDSTSVGSSVSTDNTDIGGSETVVASEASAVSNEFSSNTTSTNNTSMSNATGADNTTMSTNIGTQNTAVGSMEAEIEMAVANTTEPDTVTDQIIANNIKQQQEELEEQQEQTGEYADSTTLIAYMGYVQGFDSYSQVQLPQASTWYEPKDIYAGVSISDNVPAFYDLYGNSLNGMKALINLQPNL